MTPNAATTHDENVSGVLVTPALLHVSTYTSNTAQTCLR